MTSVKAFAIVTSNFLECRFRGGHINEIRGVMRDLPHLVRPKLELNFEQGCSFS